MLETVSIQKTSPFPELRPTPAETPIARKAIYQDQNYITLYRYENSGIPYNESREGIVSKKNLIGAWFTDSTDDLRRYFIQRAQGTRGGNFITVRVHKDDLANYYAATHPDTKEMDIETGNYIIPTEIMTATGLTVEAPFKDAWENKRNVPFKDWSFVGEFIQTNLSDVALQAIA